MSKQTRRSVSVKGRTMKLLKIAASRSRQSVSDYVETRLAPFLERFEPELDNEEQTQDAT